MSIRRASLADIPIVQALARAIWQQHYPGILTQAQIDYMLLRSYASDALAPFVTNPTYGLALADAEEGAVAFCAWYPPGDPGTMKLDKLYVQPQRHRQGIGRALIGHVAAAARRAGCHTLVLNVNRHNAASIRAYERCGFAIAGQGDFPIGGGFVMEDYIMTRPLQERPAAAC